jgi:hypothetical protein
MYEGGGASYHESRDGGATWTLNLSGIPDDVPYFYSLAVDPGDPDSVILSGARDPFSGHAVAVMGLPTWSSLYRLHDGGWTEVRDGLPEPDGTAMGTLCAAGPGVFYYVLESGDLYRSEDGGRSFTMVTYGDEVRGNTARPTVALPE